MELQFEPMTKEYAEAIIGWRYGGEYAVYNMDAEEGIPDELLAGGYFVTTDDRGVAGFACFGEAARIPAAEESAYARDAVDIGLGMRPDLCGCGKGERYFAQVVALARQIYGHKPLRLTVAGFNERARKVYERSGFRVTHTATHAMSKKPFLIMIHF